MYHVFNYTVSMVRGLSHIIVQVVSQVPNLDHLKSRAYTFDFSREPSWAPAVDAILNKFKMAVIHFKVMS